MDGTRSLDDILRAEVAALEAASLRRQLRATRRLGGAMVSVEGRLAVDFASNDYLGLATDSRVSDAAATALNDAGVGAAAARLITGDDPLHEQLEVALAELKGTERALLFPSGYAANVGALQALAGRDDAIYSDALNHASIVDGCRLSRATVRVFPHANLQSLSELLAEDQGRFRRRWIAVESVYSMDGDLFPLDQLVALARRHGAHTLVDDAHASGVIGPDGRGGAAHFGVDVDVIVATLGKAFGTAGAFVAGSHALCEIVMHRARSFVFTTASPPSIAAATLRALEIARDEPWRRTQLLANARRLRDGLRALGIHAPGEPDGHVVPVPLGDSARVVAAGEQLLERGYVVGAIRPPTVPPGGARLRVSASAAHTHEQIDGLLDAIADVLPIEAIAR